MMLYGCPKIIMLINQKSILNHIIVLAINRINKLEKSKKRYIKCLENTLTFPPGQFLDVG